MTKLTMQANKTSILVDASKYIKDLKDKVEEAAVAAALANSSSSSSTATSVGSAMPAMVRTSYCYGSNQTLQRHLSSSIKELREQITSDLDPSVSTI